MCCLKKVQKHSSFRTYSALLKAVSHFCRRILISVRFWLEEIAEWSENPNAVIKRRRKVIPTLSTSSLSVYAQITWLFLIRNYSCFTHNGETCGRGSNGELRLRHGALVSCRQGLTTLSLMEHLLGPSICFFKTIRNFIFVGVLPDLILAKALSNCPCAWGNIVKGRFKFLVRGITHYELCQMSYCHNLNEVWQMNCRLLSRNEQGKKLWSIKTISNVKHHEVKHHQTLSVFFAVSGKVVVHT